MKIKLYRSSTVGLNLSGYKLLMGPRYAHWNNAEIGSHLKFFRKPNIFEKNVYGSMVYFHC